MQQIHRGWWRRPLLSHLIQKSDQLVHPNSPLCLTNMHVWRWQGRLAAATQRHHLWSLPVWLLSHNHLRQSLRSQCWYRLPRSPDLSCCASAQLTPCQQKWHWQLPATACRIKSILIQQVSVLDSLFYRASLAGRKMPKTIPSAIPPRHSQWMCHRAGWGWQRWSCVLLPIVFPGRWMDKGGCWGWVAAFPSCCFACFRTCFGVQDTANSAAFQRLFVPQCCLGSPFNHKHGGACGGPSPVTARMVQDKQYRGVGKGLKIWEGIWSRSRGS